jgi:hypothetical protein
MKGRILFRRAELTDRAAAKTSMTMMVLKEYAVFNLEILPDFKIWPWKKNTS